jgi:hypothetical protein
MQRAPPPWIRALVRIRLPVMLATGFCIGDRVTRLNDGAVGVVAEIGPMGSLSVRWDSSGVLSVVVPAQIRAI